MPQRINPKKQLRQGIAFRARRSAALSVQAESVIVFDAVDYDYGASYNSTTGTFTAPIAGVYAFTVAFYTEAASTARVLIAFGTTGTGASSGARVFDTESTRLRRASASFEAYLPASGTCQVSMYSATSVNIANTGTFFSGHLVTKV